MDDPRTFSVSVSADGADIVVRASGELDLASAPHLQRTLDQVQLPPSGRVILDLRALSFTDAAGLRVIDAASKKLGERLIVFGLRPPVRQLFEVTRLDQLVLRAADTAPDSDVPAGNVAYVRRLWEGFRTGGLPRLAEMVPDDAEWRPLERGGRPLRGVWGLAEFWAPGRIATSFAALGDDVLVVTQLEDGSEVWSLFWFDDRRLLGAATFEDQSEALAAHRLRMAS